MNLAPIDVTRFGLIPCPTLDSDDPGYERRQMARLAIHEAGHVWAYLHHGVAFDYVTLLPEQGATALVREYVHNASMPAVSLDARISLDASGIVAEQVTLGGVQDGACSVDLRGALARADGDDDRVRRVVDDLRRRMSDDGVVLMALALKLTLDGKTFANGAFEFVERMGKRKLPEPVGDPCGPEPERIRIDSMWREIHEDRAKGRPALPPAPKARRPRADAVTPLPEITYREDTPAPKPRVAMPPASAVRPSWLR